MATPMPPACAALTPATGDERHRVSAAVLSGRENDGSGLDYYRARYYHPTFGRFVSEDPLDWAGGDANLYAYAFNNPLGWIDPLGLLSMCYDYSNLHLYDDDGNQIGSYPGTSGNAGSGAIPRGRYKLVPREISSAFGIHYWLRRAKGDWGNYRAPLHPSPSNGMGGRFGFYLHGGRWPGSAGCIDIGRNDIALFPQLQNELGTIPLTVGGQCP